MHRQLHLFTIWCTGLRLRRPKLQQIDIVIDPVSPSNLESASITSVGSGGNTTGTADPQEWYKRHWPQAPKQRALALELGCAEILQQKTLEESGFEYLGVDYDSTHAQMLVDAHALPFRDGSVPFILAFAFLEHLQHPLIAMRETCRVLQSGGTLLGTVSFLEPFHMNSFYHHTHLGLWNTLTVAGFSDLSILPSRDWSGLTALFQMGLFPETPMWFRKAIVWPIEELHRLWWKRLSRHNGWFSEGNRIQSTTGALSFYATRT